MIPCAAKCSHFHEGCHKTCSEWPRLAANNGKEASAKNEWLKVHNQACFDFIRSMRPISGCKNHF